MLDTVLRVHRILWIFVIYNLYQVLAIFCEEAGKYCEYGCCGSACCSDPYNNDYTLYRWSIWNMWYFWFIIIFILLTCFGGCGYWRRRQLILARQRSANRTIFAPAVNPNPYAVNAGPGIGTMYSPYGGQYAMPAGAVPMPPPYAEVISKPDEYPESKDELPPAYPGVFAAPAPPAPPAASVTTPDQPQQTQPITGNNTDSTAT